MANNKYYILLTIVGEKENLSKIVRFDTKEEKYETVLFECLKFLKLTGPIFDIELSYVEE